MANEEGESQENGSSIVLDEWNRVVMDRVYVPSQQEAQNYIDRITEAYADPKRHYHNLSHIEDSVAKLEPYKQRPDYPRLFMAILMHDVVYNPLASTPGLNERQSASLAEQMMERLALPGAHGVRRMIEATASHRPQKEDEQLICSIDLSILAEPWGVYEAYAEGIRKEYVEEAGVPEAIYVEKRYSTVLEPLSKLGQRFELFSHPDFTVLNRPAYANLRHEMRLLKNV